MDKLQVILEKELKRDFKLATIKQGEEMSSVIRNFITDYVKKYA